MLYSTLLLISIYYIACLVYSIKIYYTDKKIYKPVLVFSFPFIGFLLILVIRLMKNKEVIDIFTEASIKESSKRSIGVDTIEDAIFMNISDGLLLGDVETRRKLMLNIIKSNPEEYINPLMDALNNEDGETSHYAASVITHMQSKILIKLQKFNYAYKEHNNDEAFLKEYAHILNTYINGGLADKKNIQNYIPYYKAVLIKLIDLNVALTSHFEEIIKIELNERSYSTSLTYSRLFLERYPQSEESYLCFLKVCVEIRDAKLLKESIEKIKEAKVILSSSNLIYFRYWVNAYNRVYLID